MSNNKINYFLKSKSKKILVIINLVTTNIPIKLTSSAIKFVILTNSYSKNPSRDLRKLFKIKDDLEKIINNRALEFGEGEHPKHYLTDYHGFFVRNIKDGASVLDIGCGYGALARSIAINKPNSRVVGIDYDKDKLNQATKSLNPSNLKFIFGDATKINLKEHFDVVVLSNVLEHISDRTKFMNKLQANCNAKIYLIRVPCYERDWQVPLREKLGVQYFNDDDHKIEHKLEEFQDEVLEFNLKLKHVITKWGEIWAICEKN